MNRPNAIEVLEYALHGLIHLICDSSNGAEIQKLEVHREVLEKRIAILRTATHKAPS